jgi:catechol 2,3-dioxygenase-like lactoylglutathione lyase family enzyme
VFASSRLGGTVLAADDGGPLPAADPTKDDVMDFKLELVPIPVSDVDRAKAFYEQAGFNVDLDFSPSEGFRVVQLTPPGSACSIAVGRGIIDTPPGSVQALHLVVSDIHAARAELVERGIEVGEVEDLGAPGKPTVSYARFRDPDGNSSALQQLPS